MNQAAFKIKSRKNIKDQSLLLRPGLTVFVGGNGSGKSSLLESLFLQSIEDSIEQTAVCFTSGPNENFSSIFDKYRAKNKWNPEALKTLSLNKYLFDISWAPFLVLLAAFSSEKEKPSLVYEFLETNNYFLKDLELKVSVKKDLLIKVENDAELTTSSFVRILEKLIRADLIEYKGSFSRKIRISEVSSKVLKSPNKILSDELFTGLLDLTDILINKLPLNVNDQGPSRRLLIKKLITAISLGSLNESVYSLENSKLFVEKNGSQFSNREFSDGEYQLLMTYAIMDLFDDPESLLLLDEMDSHVHQKMIPVLWKRASEAKGVFLSTTHNPTSLKYCNSTRILALKFGQIISAGEEYASELSNIFDNNETVSKVLALGFKDVPNLLIIDGYKDWAIFVILAKRKLGKNFDQRLIEKITLHKVNSDQIKDLSLDNKKYQFIQEIIRCFDSELTNDEIKNKTLKNVIVIFDRDTRDLKDKYKDKNLSIIKEEHLDTYNKGLGFKTFGVSLHRREIENYLLVPSILKSKESTEIVGFPGTSKMELNAKTILNSIEKNDEETLATIDCKDFINKHICNEKGRGHFSKDLTEALVETYDPSEISPYIQNLHNFLIEKLFES